MLDALSRSPGLRDFVDDARATCRDFVRTLLAEENDRSPCPATQAGDQGRQVLLILDRLFFLLDDNADNHRLVTLLALSTGVWIAQHGASIDELDLIVSGIAVFANQTNQQQDLEELYEISLHVLYAVDERIRGDQDEINPQHPWRLLLLNHAIIATRTGDPDLARRSYDRLIAFVPDDAGDFFAMGLRKAEAGHFSPQCHKMLRAYREQFSSRRRSSRRDRDVGFN